MERKLFLMDGATGTELWRLAKNAGVAQVPVWRYNIEHPEFVLEVARSYVDAGSDIILANTFGANSMSVKQSSDYDPAQVVSSGVKLAKEAAQNRVKVALDVGPLTELMEPYGDLEEDDVKDIYHEMFKAGIEAGADMIFIETFIDLSMMCVAAKEAKTFGVPVLCSMSFEKSGKTIMGNSVEDVAHALDEIGVDAIGLNCSLGPDQALPVVRTFKDFTTTPILFKPNAGMPILTPDGQSVASVDAQHFVDDVAPALQFVTYVGGCCGSSPLYIEKLKERIHG